MQADSLKRVLDICFLAKRIVETLPELPQHMKPRHIHVLDAVESVRRQQGVCRVSDVSEKLRITAPSVTRLIQELEKLGLLEKQTDREDGRFTLLELTETGTECVKRYVMDFQEEWAGKLGNVTDKQAEEMICIVEELWRTMPRRSAAKKGSGETFDTEGGKAQKDG